MGRTTSRSTIRLCRTVAVLPFGSISFYSHEESHPESRLVFVNGIKEGFELQDRHSGTDVFCDNLRAYLDRGAQCYRLGTGLLSARWCAAAAPPPRLSL
jgi:hypothetical protein